MKAATKRRNTIARKVSEALGEPGGTYLLSKNHPQPNAVHQVVHQLRKRGVSVSTERTDAGTLYTVDGVSAPIDDDSPTAALDIHRPTALLVHPNLGTEMRVTSLGEHPSGRVIVGLRDRSGQVWFTALLAESDL